MRAEQFKGGFARRAKSISFDGNVNESVERNETDGALETLHATD